MSFVLKIRSLSKEASYFLYGGDYRWWIIIKFFYLLSTNLLHTCSTESIFRGISKVEQRLLIHEGNDLIIYIYLYITIIVFYVNINILGKELYKANEIICNNKL